MYQDPGGVEDGEYHIMYGPYGSLKLGPDPASPTIKLAAVVQDDQGTLAATGSLGTVTLSAGEALVSSALADSSLAVSSAALTSTSLNEHLAVSSQVRSNPNPDSSIMTISAVQGEASLGDTDLDDDPLAVATLASDQSHGAEVDMNQIVSTSGQAVLDGGQLVTSSSIDAVVTSVFASDCVGMSVSGTGRKLPPQQVFVKLLGDDSHVLDMVQIIAEHDVDSGPNGFNILTRNGTIVQKLTEGGIISDVSEEQYQSEEVLRPEEGGKLEDEAGRRCRLKWTCGYCNLEFPSSEACGCHQEKDCTENPNIQTTTSQATVDALMSPLRSSDEATYELKLDGSGGRITNIATEGATSQEEDCEEGELLTVWVCAVCGIEFTESKALNDHLVHHTVHELASALLKLTVPHQIIKKQRKVRSTNTETTGDFPSDPLQTLTAGGGQLKWSQDCSEVKFTKVEEGVVVENPGDTPPSTPPQEKLSHRNKKKPGPKARPKEKVEKRKYVRKIGEDGQPVCQREHRTPPAGQGSRDPHTCQICNKVLSSRGNLSKHMVLHKSKKPFVCSICGMGFNAKRDKKHHHLQHHTSERPNKCSTCGKGFVDINYLHEHMIFHKQERPFSCDICGKVFRTARCVKRHKKRHRKDRNFTCSLCFRSFAIKADLSSHDRKVHRGGKRPQPGRQQPASLQHNGHQQQQQPHQQQQQHAKTKEPPEFIIPDKSPPHIISEEQLISGDLEPGGHKDTGNIFLTDSLSVPVPIIPITAAESGSCPYGIALTTPPATQGSGGTGDTQATYIMIEGTDRGEVTTSHNLPTTPGLIMYTPLPTPSQQVGGELQGSREQLVGVEGEQRAPPLHPSTHHNSRTQDAGGLVEGQASGLALDTTPTNPTVEISGSEAHDPTPHNPSHHDSASHDPSQTFPLELISQTIQLELQRSQASSTPYLT